LACSDKVASALSRWVVAGLAEPGAVELAQQKLENE